MWTLVSFKPTFHEIKAYREEETETWHGRTISGLSLSQEDWKLGSENPSLAPDVYMFLRSLPQASKTQLTHP